MSGLVFLFVAVLVSAAGTLLLYMHNRGSTSLDNGVDEFQREMRALSPDKRTDDRHRGNHN